MKTAQFIRPVWRAPPGIRAASTLRTGGTSAQPFSSLNLGTHVGDDAHQVAENRRRLAETLGLKAQPLWLDQVHGTTVIDANHYEPHSQADACVATGIGQACVVMTADCLPVLFCTRDGTKVAAAHAGWRGLVNGVLEATVKRMHAPGRDILAWLGPAIGPAAFEVGNEVHEAFCRRDPGNEAAFTRNANERWQADLFLLAQRQLNKLQVEEIYGGDFCTHSEPERFFSHRRDGRTGRMATLIWREHA